MDIFIILIVVIASQMYTYVQIYQIVHFKYVQFFLCQSYLHKAGLAIFKKLFWGTIYCLLDLKTLKSDRTT